MWKHPENYSSPSRSTIFCLSHGGDIEADGNYLFTASQKAMGADIDARELRRRTVKRFTEDLGSDVCGLERDSIDSAVIKHLYSPDLKAGGGIHVVQEVKLLAKKENRESLDVGIKELVDLGLQRFKPMGLMPWLMRIIVLSSFPTVQGAEYAGPPLFLFMKETGWCGAGADHYESLIAHSAPLISQEKAAVGL